MAKKKELFICMLIFVTFHMNYKPLANAENWPEKKITVTCGVTAGGFADTSTRVFVSEISKILGVSVIVINKPGGAGGIAAESVWIEPADGYNLEAHGGGFRTFAVMGIHKTRPQDWYIWPTVGYVGAISVRVDSPIKDMNDLIAELKKNPGMLPYAASQASTSWRQLMEIMKKATGIGGKYVPYEGSSASQVALLAGDIPFICTGVGEQASLLKGKKIRALAVFDTKAYELQDYGTIPPITDYMPEMKSYLPFPAWGVIAARADTPKSVLSKLDDAFAKASKSEAVKQYCQKFDVIPIGKVGKEAQDFYLKQASIESWLLWELGIAKLNPADFNIPKPQ